METAAPQPTPEKKPLLETVIISTPVLLTVIATFILGRSSSEMTQAQYHRALAGQKQSKVANEWAFFQAKRTRGTNYETTSVALFAQKAGPFTPDTLADAAQALIREIALTEKDTQKLTDALRALDKKAAAELEQIKAALDPPEPQSKDEKSVLTPASVKNAFAALESYPTFKQDKSTDDDSTDKEQRKLLDQIVDDIRAFKPDSEIALKTRGLKPETIDKALAKARANAAAITKLGKSIDRVLEEFDALVDRQMALAREYQRIVGSHLTALAKSNGDSEDIRKLERRLDRIRDLSARLLTDYKAARYAFDGQRYEDDARSNQKAAFLYDVHVLQSSAKSDKHLSRSFGFMIAMLVAQVGVTIGSMALAFKRRIPVWALAALAGISAIIFGVLVFLEMAPMF